MSCPGWDHRQCWPSYVGLGVAATLALALVIVWQTWANEYQAAQRLAVEQTLWNSVVGRDLKQYAETQARVQQEEVRNQLSRFRTEIRQALALIVGEDVIQQGWPE